MNTYQEELYANLCSLVKNDEAFYAQDFTLDGHTYRIFNYRLASWTGFQSPGALNCRGTMFEVDPTIGDKDGNDLAIRLASLPMHKFFNLGEGNQEVDLSLLDGVELKADGSLISTYVHNGELRLKSKGSLFSEQAINAMKWLDHPENSDFKKLLINTAMNHYTVNMEWCSPDNRIVIGYEVPHLKILNVRSNADGHYVRREMTPLLHPYWIDTIEVSNVEEFVAQIPNVKGIEGYILKFSNGLWIKCKGSDYLHLHKCKDSVNNPRALFEAVVDETADDLLALFHNDPLAKKQIGEMQEKVSKIYNHVVASTEAFYEANKKLERKDFAIKGQQELERMYFSLAMNKYLGKDVNYKEFLKKHYKDFGIREEAQNVTE